jgi:hypothetical protein
MPRPKHNCEWCFGTKDVMPIFIPETPVLEWMEEKLISVDEDFSQSELSEWEEWEMLCYDDMIKQIRRGHVCKKCWTQDQKLYDKYYDTDNNDDFIRLI